MRTTQTVNLELVRHGPPHNQLLSPLVAYLALCGNKTAEAVRFPYEHREFLRRLRALRYEDDSGDKPAGNLHVREIGEDLRDALATVPGLPVELGRARPHSEELTHLQMILSATELEMLPFEAALTPSGLHGEGEPLTLQSVSPVSLTRAIRNVVPSGTPWPSRPRILFAFACPSGYESVPAREHRAALRSALKPWRRPDPTGNRDTGAGLLTVLENATLKMIRTACEKTPYTHIHLLAHGELIPGEEQFGVALHDEQDVSQPRLVKGDTLACALGRPAVVTLASCDSANPSTVIEPGRSVAHALHRAGVPLVVASQFPLTMHGSTLLVEMLYRELLWGADPRISLYWVRRALHERAAETHNDWVSLLAYATFPTDFAAQLQAAQVSRAIAAANASLARALVDLARIASEERRPERLRQKLDVRHREMEGELVLALERLENARSEPLETRQLAEIYGLLGSIEKRRAEILMLKEDHLGPRGARGRPPDEVLATLKRARDWYARGFKMEFANHWVLTQYLSLCALLEGRIDPDLFTVARKAAEREENPLWSHGTLAELAVLSVLLPEGKSRAVARAEAVEHARKFVEPVSHDPFALFSTRRQFERYQRWSRYASGRQRFKELVKLATAVLAVLPPAPYSDGP